LEVFVDILLRNFLGWQENAPRGENNNKIRMQNVVTAEGEGRHESAGIVERKQRMWFFYA
jgi:hypothetical protein